MNNKIAIIKMNGSPTCEHIPCNRYNETEDKEWLELSSECGFHRFRLRLVESYQIIDDKKEINLPSYPTVFQMINACAEDCDIYVNDIKINEILLEKDAGERNVIDYQFSSQGKKSIELFTDSIPKHSTR